VLATGREHVAQLVFSHRNGDRIPVLVAGGRVVSDTDDSRYVLTVRDVSVSHRRERRLSELASRDPETALLNQRGFEERLGEAVRQALAGGGNLSVALLELGDGVGERGIFGTPEGLLAVERLHALVRAGEAVARVGDELAWILPDTDARGAVRAVSRAREELADVAGIEVTAGVCDLATAGDALSLYALADRALAEARRGGVDATATYPSDAVLRRGTDR
jgi:GGDEF domain-containing protein